jgi:acyl-CoA thioester hydrolase
MTHLVYQRIFPVRWGDMDALGHVNNTEYFNYASETRIDWINELGHNMIDDGVGPVIVHTECTFLKSVVFPAQIVDDMYLEKMGTSSFTARHEIRVEGDADLYAETRSTIVWVNYSEGKSVPLPEWLRQELVKYL